MVDVVDLQVGWGCHDEAVHQQGLAALGELGDPRFERRSGPHGDYLLPPLADIEGGTYPMGLDDGPYDNEKPAHTVELEPFQMGAFLVTNAEYALFMAAGGYEDEQWWDTDEALAWLRGEGSTDGQKQTFVICGAIFNPGPMMTFADW